MNYSLNLLKGGLYRGLLYGVIKGHTRSLDSGSMLLLLARGSGAVGALAEARRSLDPSSDQS